MVLNTYVQSVFIWLVLLEFIYIVIVSMYVLCFSFILFVDFVLFMVFGAFTDKSQAVESVPLPITCSARVWYC